MSAALLSATQALAAETLYGQRIQPLFDTYCIQCHGVEKQKGGRRFDAYAHLTSPGDSEPPLEPGASAESLLVRRMALPLEDDDHMPPEGKRQPTAEELALLRRWIDAGADLNAPFENLEALAPSAEAAATAPPLRPWSEIEEAVTNIMAAGVFEILPLSQENPGLRVRIEPGAETVRDADLAALTPVAAQILWLDLSGTGIGDNGLAHLAGMKRLERLHLDGTAITSAGLEHLAHLPRLAYLNLHGCRVTDAGIGALAAVLSLRQVFLWGTDVTLDGAAVLRERLYDAAAAQELEVRIAALEAERAALAVKVELGVSGDGGAP